MNPNSMTNSDGYYVHPRASEAGACEPRIRSLITAVENAQDAVLQAVMEELDKAARRLRITRMDFVTTSTFYRGNREIENRELAAIESLYLEVCPCGFMGFWTAKEGWK